MSKNKILNLSIFATLFFVVTVMAYRQGTVIRSEREDEWGY